MTHRRCLAASLSLALLGLCSSSARALKLEILDQTLIASSSQGNVVFFGVSREIDPDDVVTRRTLAEVRADEDGDGIVSLALDRPVAPTSVWAAVDLATGESALATPLGFVLQQGTWLGRGVGHSGPEPERGTLQDERFQSELLVVRPGLGAWTISTGDGSATDEDGAADGATETALDRMTALESSSRPPEDFAEGDVLLLVDARSLEVVLEKVGGVQ